MEPSPRREPKTRIEQDSWGELEVDAERLWGAQTERSRRNFRISGERMPGELIQALVLVKKAVALVHVELGLLDAAKGRAIVSAADEVLAGRWDSEFPLVVWQTGSGTQTNMNVNEVLANRASEILGGERGARRLVHPNDDVNRGQSTNDAFPTAIHVAVTEAFRRAVIPALVELGDTLRAKATAFGDVVKIGRTHLMDATPLTLGQEISGWAAAARAGRPAPGAGLAWRAAAGARRNRRRHGVERPPRARPARGPQARRAQRPSLRERAQQVRGARRARRAGPRSRRPAHGGRVAVQDRERRAAGWRPGRAAGIGEIQIPENEPGSSIMPGKVNPTQAEALTMAAAQVMGNDVTVGSAGMSGQLQLNVFMPVIAYDVLQSCRLIADGCRSFREHCALGIEPRRERIAQNLERSLMLVTALNPHIGYDAAARIAKTAHATGRTLRETAIELGLVTAEQFDAWVKPEQMVGG